MADQQDATTQNAVKVALTRLFDAPRERVFAAWTEPEQMARWWGPQGYTIPVCEAELRPGGAFRYCMRARDGEEHWVRGTIDEIEPPFRLTTTSFVDHEPGEPPFRVVSIVTFTEEAGRTRVSIDTTASGTGQVQVPPGKGIELGWSQSLDKLEAELAGRGTSAPVAVAQPQGSATHDSFRIERTIEAPASRVFQAFADPEAKARWFGGTPDQMTMLDRRFDFQPGGREHASGRWANGTVSAFDAFYWDIVPDRRIVYTYEMHIDGRKISVSLATVEIDPVGSATRLTVTEQGVFLDGYEDKGAREHGTRMLLERLADSLR